MLTALIGYVTALVVFFAVDMVWLGIMAPRYYRPIMGDIALATVNLPAAFAFYVLYPIGLLIFAIYPALKSGSLTTALIYGALFGFFTYATYDLTNQATLAQLDVVVDAGRRRLGLRAGGDHRSHRVPCADQVRHRELNRRNV